MKSLMLLWRVVAEEFGDRCGTRTSMDVETLHRRVEHEGLSFLTITLPQFGKDFERSLDQGAATRNLFQGFTWAGGLPRFLSGFLGLVFDPASGRLIDNPDVEAVRAIRQLTSLFGKLELPTTTQRQRQAMKGFIDAEEEVKQAETTWSNEDLVRFRRLSLVVWGDVLARVDKTLWLEHNGGPSDPEWPYLRPKHGPGATADRLSGNEKFDLSEWPERLEKVFPFVEYAIPSHRYHDSRDRVDFLEPGSERPVRVISVPKTMKTPRIIAIEPTAMQYMQQAVSEVLVRSIQSDTILGSMVGFDDQHVNRRLACEGSLTGELATLDLSEASDRVSFRLVEEMVSRFPHFREALDATRSRFADVRGHGVIPLAKFASMGSALTFPVEAMVFATVVMHGIESTLGRPLTREDVESLKGRVRVYGDDIIVPVDYVHGVVESLSLFGFKVNRRKSFWTGRFRESCGREYFAGEDVSTVKVRKVIPTPNGAELPTSLHRHADSIESFVALRNNFYLSGLWRTAAWLDRRLVVLFKGDYPVIAVTDAGPEEGWLSRSNLLGRWSFLGYQAERTHPTLHYPIVRGYKAFSKSPPSPVSGLGALQKVLGSRRSNPFEDPEHLQRAGRPHVVRIKRVVGRPF